MANKTQSNLDRVTRSLMDKFAENNELSHDNDSALFEEFATYCVVSKLMDNDFTYEDIDEMQIGNGNDGGIDSLGILINGEFIGNLTSLSDILDHLTQKIDVLVIFVQAKTSQTFDSVQIRNFGDGIVDVLKEAPHRRQNESLREKWKMLNLLINNFSEFRTFRGRAYYVTNGQWTRDQDLMAAIDLAKTSVDAEGVFKEFEYLPVDATLLKNYYSNSRTKVSTQIDFPLKVTMPLVPEVDEGWSGFLLASEFLKLITDENGDLRRSLFYDNVRDFQGNTPANKGIQETLESDHPENMSILNNGVTIIANKCDTLRDLVALENYQIVNGCQTSYVLYNEREHIHENYRVYLPVKLIITSSAEVSAAVTIGNNSQTEVKSEALLALTEVPKELERFFDTYTGKKHLYYERRSNQYNDNPNVEKTRIVDIRLSLRTYSSMFYGIPHVASRWIGKLYKDYSASVFDGTHASETFYTSAYALYKFNFYIRRKTFERKYSKFKYFILYMIRLYLTGDSDKNTPRKKIIEQCHQIDEVLWNDDQCLALMDKMVSVINEVASDNLTSNVLTDKKSFLISLDERVRELRVDKANKNISK